MIAKPSILTNVPVAVRNASGIDNAPSKLQTVGDQNGKVPFSRIMLCWLDSATEAPISWLWGSETDDRF